MVARAVRCFVLTGLVAATTRFARGAAPDIEDLTGCRLPNARAVLPLPGSAQASNGALLKMGTRADLIVAPMDGVKPLPPAALLDAERGSKTADLQYLANDGGSLWAFSGCINELGLGHLSTFSGKKLAEAGEIKKTSRNYAAGEFPGVTEGFVYLVKTTEGKWALVRVLEKTPDAMVIQYVVQPDGNTTFDVPANKPIPYERPEAAEVPATAPASTGSAPAIPPDLMAAMPDVPPAVVPHATLPPVVPAPASEGDRLEKGVIVLTSKGGPDSPKDAGAVAALAKERSDLIQRRLEIIAAPATTPEEVDRKSQAMSDLTALHADEPAVADALVAQISFLNPRSPSREFSTGSLHPAYGALTRMGATATAAAMKGLRKLDLDTAGEGIDSPVYKVGLLGRVIRTVEGEDVAEFIFKSAAEKETDPKRKAVFEYLLNSKP